MIFSTFLQSRKQRIYLLFALAAGCALLFFLLPETVHAQGFANDPKTNELMREIQTLFNMILNAMSMFLWPIIYLIGGLLDNELIFGGEMGEALLGIWVQIRNIVNIIFVLILLVIAIYNVLGLNEQGPLQSLQLKTVLPKFVIGLLIVNFSYLGAKVFLDFTNVLTQAVFALPTNFSQAQIDINKFESQICSGPEAPLAGYFCEFKGGSTDEAGAYKYNQRAIEFFKSIDQRNISLAMAINLGKLPQQKFVDSKVENILQLSFNILFGLVMYAVYLVSFVTLFIVLIGRLAVLWVAVALSPLIALTIVLPNIGQQLGGGKLNIGDLFMKHALSPLIIGLFMSIGYIMIDTFNNFPSAANGFFSGVPLDALDPNSLASGINDLQQFLVAAAAAILVFTGVFAATEGTVTSFITDKIRDGTKTFGTFMAKLPMYAQVIPVAGREGITPAQLFATMHEAPRALERARGMPIAFGNADVQNLENRSTPEFFQKFAKNPGVLADRRVQELMKGHLVESGIKEDEVKNLNADELARYITSIRAPKELQSVLASKNMDYDKLSGAMTQYQSRSQEEKPETAESKKKDVPSQFTTQFNQLTQQERDAFTLNGRTEEQIKEKFAAITKLHIGMKTAFNSSIVEPEVTKLGEDKIGLLKAIAESEKAHLDATWKVYLRQAGALPETPGGGEGSPAR